jgi:hypothetical protein
MNGQIVVYPHEFFRIDFDLLLQEGTRQERIWPANIGEAQEVQLMHDYWDQQVLPLILSNQWVFEGAERLVQEWVQGCLDQMAVTGRAAYDMQQKLEELKAEVTEFLAHAATKGWTRHQYKGRSVNFKKASDFYMELHPRRINERGALAGAQALRHRAVQHERQQVRLIMCCTRDLFAHVFPQIAFVAKRAVAVRDNLTRAAMFDEPSDPTDDLSWFESRVKAGTGLHLVTSELRDRYRIIRHAASHPGQFEWVAQTNVVRFQINKSGQWIEFDVDDYHRYYRRLVLFCDLGLRGILCAYCDRTRSAECYDLVQAYFASFPEDYRAGIPGHCIPYSPSTPS